MTRSSRVIVAVTFLFALGFACAAGFAAEDGWKVLFDGKDLSAFQDTGGGESQWLVEDGALVRKAGAGYIWSKERFGDFVLDLEFKTEGNSGIFIRTDNPRNPVQTGIEIQVDRPRTTPGKHSCGALYDLVAPTKEMTKADQWNHIVITCKDNVIQVEMNGEQIIDADLNTWTEPNKNPDGTRNKFGAALKDFKREGHIGFQDHGAAVAYRNIKVKPLD